MSLLEDLQSLDLSAITSAKLDISTVINSEQLVALVSNGAASSVLGDLGRVLQVAADGFDEPEQLIEPITQVLSGVLDELDTDIPLGDYVEAVSTAARIVAQLIGMLSNDPNAIRFGGSLDIGTALSRAGAQFGDHAAVVSGNLSRLRALVQSVERGLPSDPTTLIAPACEILLPFATDGIDATRAWASGLQRQLDRVTIDPALSQGLVAAVGRVRVAADAGDAVALRAALTGLSEIRSHTLQQLAAALRAVASTVSGIRVAQGAGVVRDLRTSLAGADDTVFELLDGWRETIASARSTVEGIDPAVAIAQFNLILDRVEATARDLLLRGVDGSVEVVKQWLRDLLREVPLRSLRMELSRAIEGAAKAIADADLDAPAQLVRAPLRELSTLLAEVDPAALVQAAVTALEDAIGQAIDQLEAALGQITEAIEQVAEQAAAVLTRVVQGLTDFRELVDELTTALENAGIMEAADQIAQTLGELREKVSTLLAEAPIPDALRSVVEQLVSTLESIDLDAAIGGPLREAAAQLQIPSDVADSVRSGLEAVIETVSSLVPRDVIADLERMMNDALNELQSLDISQLTAGVGEVLDQAASVFEGVRVAELIAPAGAVFDEITAAVDRVHPRTLLAPAIDLYAQLLGAIPVPQPETIANRAGNLTAQAGESIARAAAEPARLAVSPQATSASAESSGPAREDQPGDLRPGDIVRLIGFLPNKLREALAALEGGGAAQVLSAIDEQFTASAALLRSLRDGIAGLESAVAASLDAALAPLTAAQLDAQLAISGSVTLSAGGFEVQAALSSVALVSPAALELELAGERRLITERCRNASAGLSGVLADDLDSVADMLEAVLPSGLLRDVDALLAALDPEPIAAELDALFVAIVDATPGFLAAVETELREIERRVRALIASFNPGALMQRYLGVLDVVREELALLDPGRLADELGEVHAQIKAALSAYDPRLLAAELDALLVQVAATIRGLDPAGLMPDLSGISAQVARISDILPVNALANVGDQLEAVGDELRALDIEGLLDAVNSLTPEVAEAITLLIDAVRDEIVALLESIRFASSNASASGSVSVGIG